MNQVDILSWNCKGFYHHYEDLRLLLATYHPYVLCLQETHLRSNQIPALSSYTVLTAMPAVNTHAHGGAMLAVKNSINFQKLDLQTDLQVIAIRIHTTHPATICCFYLPPHESLDTNTIQTILNKLPTPVILVGDFNAHNTLWGSWHINQRGRVLEDIIEQYDLTILNTEPTHYNCSYRTWSTLDLVITSPCISNTVQTYHHSDMAGSDHVPILVSGFLPQTNVSLTPSDVLNYKKTDWKAFLAHQNQNPLSLTEGNDTCDATQYLSNKLVHLASICTPPNKPPRRKLVPWWNTECAEALHNRRRALKTLKRNPTLENHINFSRLQAKARFTFKQAKRKSWQNYTSSITSRTPPSEVWNKIRAIEKKKSFHLPSSILADDTLHTDLQVVANLFADQFASVSAQPSSKPPGCITYFNITEASTVDYNQTITFMELKSAIQVTKPAAVGTDKIHIHMLKHASSDTLHLVLQLFNQLWDNGLFPQTWRTAIVLPLLKPNKNPSLVDSYRPISLTSVLCKIFEKIVQARLQYLLQSRNLLTPVQHGFRPFRSTTDNLVFLQHQIHQAFAHQNHLLAIFFDFTKAFDTVRRDSIITQLLQWNIRGKMTTFIQNFLHERYFYVRIGDTHSRIHSLNTGVPQGSVLSPVLFNIAVNAVIAELQSPVQGMLFADDLTVFVTCKNTDTGTLVLQHAVNRLSAWSSTRGLVFSPTKTKAVHFCRLRNCEHQLNIALNGHQLPCESKVPYLGLIYDNKLRWKFHISSIKAKCNARLNLLRKLSHTTYGADTQSLLRLYYALIQSVCNYGYPAYSSAATTALQSLNSIHNSALRLATGAFRSTPTTSLFYEAAVLPQDLHQHYLLSKYSIRLKSSPDLPMSSVKPLNSQLTHTQQCFLHKARMALTLIDLHTHPPLHSASTILLPPWVTPPLKFDTSLLDNYNRSSRTIPPQVQQNFLESYNAFKKVYTDASKTSSSSGCAIIHGDSTIRYPLPAVISTISCELYAILLAIAELGNTTPPNALILTDSLTAIHLLKHTPLQHPLAHDIWSRASTLSTHICIAWVPGHSTFTGNTRADRAAKEAASISPVPELPTPPQDYLAAIRHRFSQLAKERFAALPQFDDNFVPTWNNTTPRRTAVVLCRVRTGHTRVIHDFLFKHVNPPSCPVCNVPYTIPHILLTCPKYNSIRFSLMFPPTLPEVLSDPSTVISFLQQAHLFSLV